MGERKARGALSAGARVVLISPEVTEGLAYLGRLGRIRLVQREYRNGDLKQAALAFAATDRPEVNRAVAADARASGILLNTTDASVAGDFFVPSVVKRGLLQVALSTGGGSPAYARMVRERLEALFGAEHEELLDRLERLRPKVMERFPDDEERRREVWGRLVNWDTLELIRQRRWDEIEEKISECLS